jgi:hypothetical protein
MTDLDRQIAELKGWRIEGDAIIDTQKGIHYWLNSPDREWWSEDDSKALELVDELRGAFMFGLASCIDGIRWIADFNPKDNPFPGRGFLGIADSRPEAICQAWVAAVTWMRGRA